MEIGETIYVHRRADWRRWLRAHFQTKAAIWLVLPHKNSDKASMVYNDAVEEALCFGWIDSIKKKLAVDAAVQRYTPRRSRSAYSQPNKERLRWLLEKGRVHSSVRAAAQRAVQPPFVFPADIVDQIKRDSAAWTWFRRQSGPYRRIRIAWVDSARERPEVFRRRLANLTRASAAGRALGYGGIEKYF